ncbi:MAG: tandem-95 repeat protein [Gammaproteobacteria bacterium]|nr:tandem-95 repeat protein [Gammaproteobacteria bacterium]
MKQQRKIITVFTRSVIATALLTALGQANAVTYNLCTGTTTKTMPDGTVVTLWGYGDDSVAGCPVSVPGPQLTIPVGDPSLTINLRNTLSEAASVIVPGLTSPTAPAPVFFTDAQGRQRARSLVAEAAANGGIQSYTYNARPGTFLYQSGSHPAVTVQMGLYGAVTGDTLLGEVYPGVLYDNEVVLVYSEIDPALHTAVAAGTYGTVAYPSTLNFAPKYYLVNGAPYATGAADLTAGAVGQRTLLRLLNAGIESHFPTLVGSSVALVAEYGNPYPYARNQFSTMLAAGMTQDAILEPKAEGRLALFDRHLRITNNTMPGAGGLISFLAIGAGTGGGPTNTAPVAVNDASTTAEDTAVIIDVAINDTDVDANLNPLSAAVQAQPLHGVVVKNADGTVTYTPTSNYNGVDSFTYNIRDALNLASNTATVAVTVTPVNDAPVAASEAYTMTGGSTLNVAAPGVLSNDTDIDGPALSAVLQTTAANGALTLNADGSFSFTPSVGFAGTSSFTYAANDSFLTSNVATVTITVKAPVNVAPVAKDDAGSVRRNSRTTNPKNTVIVNVIGNDTDADGTIAPATVAVQTAPKKGTVVVNANGTVTYTPSDGKSGADTFSYRVRDNAGALSNTATVRINIL